MMLKHPFFIAFLINVFFFILCQSFGLAVFGAVDDFFMARILEGVYGSDYNVHMTFVNVIYGYVLLPLYHMFPNVGWYYIGEKLEVFASFTIISYVIIKHLGNRWGSVLSMLFVAAFASDFYLTLQFTQCATVLTAAGIALFIHGLISTENKGKFQQMVPLIISVCFMFWGSVMRLEAFLMGIPFLMVVLVLQFKKTLSQKRNVAVALTMLIILVSGGIVLNKSEYTSPEYKKYMDFQGPRAVLGDGRTYDDQAVYEDLEELGYSGKDFAMLKNWKFYDNEVFSPTNISIIIQTIQRHYFKPSLWDLPMEILGKLQECVKNPPVWFWIFVSLLIMIANGKRSFVVWGLWGMIVCYIGYFILIGRFVYRVETGVWLYAIAVSLPFIRPLKFVKPRLSQRMWKWGSILIICCIATANVFIYAKDGEIVRSPNHAEPVQLVSAADTADFVALQIYMDSMPDSCLFIFPHNDYMRLSHHRLPPYKTENFGSWERIVPQGYWTPYFPDIEDAFRKRGMTNPMEDMIKPNVYVVNDNKECDYLQRHYYDSVKVDSIRDFNGLVIYKYSVVEDSL